MTVIPYPRDRFLCSEERRKNDPRTTNFSLGKSEEVLRFHWEVGGLSGTFSNITKSDFSGTIFSLRSTQSTSAPKSTAFVGTRDRDTGTLW